MPRFVVLEHVMPGDSPRTTHWDLMLEAEGVLWTWALPRPPVAGDSLDAEQLADHRLAYLDYEGPISDGRGSVTRWDRGSCELKAENDRDLVAVLRGERLVARIHLIRDKWEAQRWRLLVEPAT